MRISDHDYNRLRILRHVRRAEGISRAELVERTGLTKGAISQLTARLIREGVLLEDMTSSTVRGRPRIRLRINASAGYAVALVPVPGKRMIASIVDLQGHEVFSRSVPIDGIQEEETLTALLADAISETIRLGHLPRSAVKSAGIVLPALMDHDRGVVHWLPKFERGLSPSPPGEPGFALGSDVQDRVGIPVRLENRAIVLARAYHWFGHDGDHDNFSMIAVLEAGLGGARYVDGQLQLGFNGMNPELSHLKVVFDGGRPCFCGGSGCLTTYAGIGGITSGIAQLLQRDAPLFGSPATAFDEAVSLARAGVPEALTAFELAGKAIGTAVASHINEHDPGHLVLLVARPEWIEFVRFSFDATVAQQTLAPIYRRTRIEMRVLESGYMLKGAAAVALETIYRADSTAAFEQ